MKMVGMALKSLGGRPLRSVLTGLGVVFGVGAVVAMLSIGEGAKREIIQKIESMGIKNLIVRSVNPRRVATGRYVQYGMTLGDVGHVFRTLDQVEEAAWAVDVREAVSYQGRTADLGVWGVSPSFASTRRIRMARGRFVAPEDDRMRRDVCALTREAVKRLGIPGDPVKQDVRIGGWWCRIVGVVESRESEAFLPYAAVKAAWGDVRRPSGMAGPAERVEISVLYLRLPDAAWVEAAANRVLAYFRRQGRADEVEVVIPYKLLQQEEAAQRTFRLAMGSIAGIALLVGGIGIMNIMLSSVTERIREIGMRRALGASERAILAQFLVEAMVLTLTGALAGLGLGVAIAKGVADVVHWPLIFSWQSFAWPFAAAVVVGLLSGVYPAHQAARLDPIRALRSE